MRCRTQGRHGDLREDRADVGGAHQPHQRRRAARRGGESLQLGEPAPEGGVVGASRREADEEVARSPVLLDELRRQLVALGPRRPPQLAAVGGGGVGAVKDECVNALGVRRGVDHRHGPALVDAQQTRPLPADSVQDGAQVLGTLFERRRTLHRVRQARPAPIEGDDAPVALQALHELGEAGVLPEHLDLREPRQDEHEDPRPLADLPIGEMQPVGARVPDLRSTGGCHRRSIASRAAT